MPLIGTFTEQLRCTLDYADTGDAQYGIDVVPARGDLDSNLSRLATLYTWKNISHADLVLQALGELRHWRVLDARSQFAALREELDPCRSS